jgi:hypothetical protein
VLVVAVVVVVVEYAEREEEGTMEERNAMPELRDIGTDVGIELIEAEVEVDVGGIFFFGGLLNVVGASSVVGGPAERFFFLGLSKSNSSSELSSCAECFLPVLSPTSARGVRAAGKGEDGRMGMLSRSISSCRLSRSGGANCRGTEETFSSTPKRRRRVGEGLRGLDGAAVGCFFLGEVRSKGPEADE